MAKRHSVVVQNKHLSTAAQQCLPFKIPATKKKKKSRQSKMMRTTEWETKEISRTFKEREVGKMKCIKAKV